jgi:DNA-binding NtrC family response regulator
MRTILVVDDERVIREGLRRLLSSEGYQVVTAQDGQEALDLLRSENIHAVLCDLKMPVKGAIEVLEESKTEYPEIPVIILTGQGTLANAVESRAKGAYAFITKPFRADCVLMLVKCATEKLPPPPKPPGIP